MRKQQKGFTAIELLVVIGIFVMWLGIVGTMIYVAVHFISKFW